MTKDIAGLSAARRDAFRADHIGFVFQQFNLLPWLSAIDNISSPAHSPPDDASGPAIRPLENQRLLTHLDLHRDLWHRPAANSIGQQQRVAAALLIGGPRPRSPTNRHSALDAPRQQAFIDLLLASRYGINPLLRLPTPGCPRIPDRGALADINRAIQAYGMTAMLHLALKAPGRDG